MKYISSFIYGLVFLIILASGTSQAQAAVSCEQKPILIENAVSDGGNGWMVAGKFGTPADNKSYPKRSLLKVFENGVELPLPHSSRIDIKKFGKGRYSHSASVDGTNESIRFSALDNSNIKTNGKAYTYCTGGTSTSSVSGPGTVDKVPSTPLGTGTVYYVSPTGNDANTGTLFAPWKTLTKAASVATAGQTVYLRGGIYDGYINIMNSGTANNPISFVAYSNEKPIIDGSKKKTDPNNPWGSSNNIINVYGNYVTLRGLEIRNSAGFGIFSKGNYVTIDQIHAHNNYFAGAYFYMSAYGSVTNSTIHDSYDYGVGGIDGGENADCVGSTSGNVPTIIYGYHTFDNNLLYNCSDDALDVWTSQFNTIKNNIVHHAGYSNNSNGGSNSIGQPTGNGNGFKLGKGGNNIVSNNIAYSNLASGFTDNSGPNNKVYNNAAFNNASGFTFYTTPPATLENNLSYDNPNSIQSYIIQNNNSWNIAETDPNFISTNLTAISSLKLDNSSTLDLGTYQTSTSTTDLPDVVISSLTYDQSTGNFSVVVKNQGTKAVDSGVTIGVAYYVDGRQKTWGDVRGPLEAGASVTIGTRGGAYTISTGTHSIMAWVDDVNRFVESDESNNKFTKSITIGSTSTTLTQVYLIGDSTTASGTGWGNFLGANFKENVKVINAALGGRSSKSFYDEGLFNPVRSKLVKGDYLLIQFGHNDEKPEYIGFTSPGIAPDYKGTFRDYLERYINESRAVGATPILITPVSRMVFSSTGEHIRTHGEYAKAVRKIAADNNVVLLDLEEYSHQVFGSLGKDETLRLYAGYNNDPSDLTHFPPEKAFRVTDMVVFLLRNSSSSLKDNLR